MAEDPVTLTKSCRYWMKLTLFQRGPLTQALLATFHNHMQLPSTRTLPRDPAQLYSELDKFRAQINSARNIRTEQIKSIILPASKQTNSGKFDVTLLLALIKLLKIYAKGSAIFKFVNDAQAWRNDLMHYTGELVESEFEEKWSNGEIIIQSLGYTTYDTESLKKMPLDTDNTYYAELLEEYKERKNGIVLDDALRLVCEHIGSDWDRLAEKIIDNTEEINRIKNMPAENSERMQKIFKLVPYGKILWSNLRNCLVTIGKDGLVDKILNKTLVTTGRYNASKRLQKIYKSELTVLNVDHVFEDYATQCELSEAYVELAIIEARDMDKIFKDGDGEFYRQLKHFDRHRVQMQDILVNGREFVIIRGIAGIGKSTMINTYTLRWAQGELLSGEESIGINFLFKFTCRDLNTLHNKCFESVESLLRAKFGEIFEFITMSDLREMTSKVLILVDGLDELQGVRNFNQQVDQGNHDENNAVQCIRSLINPISPELQGHKTIVVGRPEACQTIRKFCVTGAQKGKIRMQMIEIIGFNEKSIISFINKSFGSNQERFDQIKEKIFNSETLFNMATIPVYLWVICQIFKERVDMEEIQNTTQLCTYAVLLFIKGHLRNKNPDEVEQKSLLELCKDQQICDEVLLLSHLSMITYQDRKVIFTAADIRTIVNVEQLHTERTGFIVKDEKNEMYQFRHLVLQEYLTALYIFLSGQISKLESDDFDSCLPVVAGLCGFEKKHSQSDVVFCFVKNLRNQYNQRKGFFRKMSQKFAGTPSQPKVEDVLQKKLEDTMLAATNDNKIEINDTCSNLMTAVHEFSTEFEPTFKEKFSSRTVSIRNLIFQHDIKHAISFLECIEKDKVEDISIANFSNNQLPSNIADLFKLYYENDITKNSCILKVGNEMSITSRQCFDDREKCLVLELSNDESNQKQHEHLTCSIIKLVNTVHVDFKLNQPVYKSLKDGIRKHNLTTENVQKRPIVTYPNLAALCNFTSLTPCQVEIASDAIFAKFKTTNHDQNIENLYSCIQYVKESLDFKCNLSEMQINEIAELLRNTLIEHRETLLGR